MWSCLLGFAQALNGANAASTGGDTVGSRTNTVIEKEFEKLLAEDEAAQAEVAGWRQEHKKLASKESESAQAELDGRIRKRLEPVQKAYTDFLRRNPNHVRTLLAYGCFLNEREDEAGAQAQWEKALKLDPNNADAYHNLAGRYSEIGPSRKAFEFFTKAIDLKPSEAVYYHNFADSLYVLRKHAMTNYGLSEQQVFGRALLLYSNAARLEPTNFAFAADLAQTYYAIKPLPHDEALKCWTNTLKNARTDLDRENVYLHFARVKMLAGQFAEAREQLNLVTNESCATLKERLLEGIAERQRQSLPDAPSDVQ